MEIVKLRKLIDEIDKEILKLLEKRFDLAKKILEEKIKKGLKLTDKKREEEIVNLLKRQISNLVFENLIEKIYPEIFEFSKKTALFLKNKKLPFKKFGILGCGLIGGSIIKALKIKNKNNLIFTVERKEDEDIKLALKEKYIDEVYRNLNEFLNNIEILILATPIETIIELAKKVAKEKVNKKLIIIDTGSTKEKIVKEFENLTNKNFEFLGTHPMAGSDKTGFKNSSPLLFINQTWIITPHKKNKKEAIKKAVALIRYLGSKEMILTPEKHDLYIAYSSHLVFLISHILFKFVSKNKTILKTAGTGFQSTTRLASGNPLMYFQIYKNNYKNIRKVLNLFLRFVENNLPEIEKSFNFFQESKKSRDKYINSLNP